MKRCFLLLTLLAVSLTSSQPARAATSGIAAVTLAASANALVQILDPALTLSPTATDYENDYVEATGASGLRVRVKTNSSTGLLLKVRCPDPAPQIALTDFLVRTQTPAGAGGSALASYTEISATDQDLWSTGTSQHPWLTVTTDIRIQNLINYDDAVGAGVTSYTNTLLYTIVAQ